MAFNAAYHRQICFGTCIYAQEIAAIRPAYTIQGKDLITLGASVTQVGVSAGLARWEIHQGGFDRNYNSLYLHALETYGLSVGGLVTQLNGKQSNDASTLTILSSIVAATTAIYDPFNLNIPPIAPFMGPIFPPAPTPPTPPMRAGWMGEYPTLLGSKRLCDLVLPGTHDSATCDINAASGIDPNAEQSKLLSLQYIPYLAQTATSLISGWARNQAFDIATQLSAGIRYLDLRVSEQNGTYWTVHAQFGTPLANVLQQVSEFLAAHPTEVVILDINHLYGIADTNRLASFILARLGNAVAAGNAFSATSTLKNFWDAGKQAVVLFKDEAAVQAHPALWSQSRIASPWLQTSSTQDLRQFLDNGLSTRDTNRLFVSQAVLDTTSSIFPGIFASPHNLAEFAAANTPGMFDWFRGWSSRPLNIVIIDWFTVVPDYVDTIIEMNLDGAILRSRIDVDDQDGGADFRSFGFQTTGDARAATLTISYPGSGPMAVAFTERNRMQMIDGAPARVKPSGRLLIISLPQAYSSPLSTQRAFISFDGTLSTYHPLTVKQVILAVVGPPQTPIDTPFIQGYSNHCEFLVDDQGGGADNRLFTFDSVRSGDSVTVTVTYPGSGPASFTLSKTSPVQTVPDTVARVKPTGTLTLEWSVEPGEDILLVIFSGTLHTMHSVTLDRIGVAIFGTPL